MLSCLSCVLQCGLLCVGVVVVCACVWFCGWIIVVVGCVVCVLVFDVGDVEFVGLLYLIL